MEILDEESKTSHMVSVKNTTYNRLTAEEVSKRELVEESFRFLLEREPKESILSSFEIGTIERYFPEYPEQISERLMK
ncbi:hypothetical protein KGY64_05535 [Candidatus Bipolaricaulota bacterium]|nr:hypothetical protein [Candidatus Bipolaricaulota bacterium]